MRPDIPTALISFLPCTKHVAWNKLMEEKRLFTCTLVRLRTEYKDVKASPWTCSCLDSANGLPREGKPGFFRRIVIIYVLLFYITTPSTLIIHVNPNYESCRCLYAFCWASPCIGG